MSWAATILTLYPEMFPGPLGHSLAGKALAEGVWSLETVQIRDFAAGRHRSVDDTPAGGGAGMVMRADVLARAIDSVTQQDDSRPKLLLSPRGRPLDQARVRELAAGVFQEEFPGQRHVGGEEIDAEQGDVSGGFLPVVIEQ